jgi:RNA polymerase sigma factor (sigma-70 family)
MEDLVASWPTIDRLDDQRLALSLRGGDADALTQIYDTYAAGLYEYCHALLRDEMTAAYALHDALIAAVEHVGRLREPERLRSWLYALARAECMRLRDDPERSDEQNEAPEIEDTLLSDTERAQREETRALVHSALSGLTGRQREALDLTVRHDLTTDELAGVLAIAPRQSAELARQARSHLDKTVAAALTARTRQDDCPSLAALADTWPLSPEACAKLVRHIENCPTCSEHQPREVSTNRLLHVLPIAAAPEELRTQVLTTATGPEHREERLALADRAMPLDSDGWPAAAEPERAAPRTSKKKKKSAVGLWPATAAAASIALIVGVVILLTPDSNEKTPSGAPAAAVPSDEASDSPSNVAPVESGLPALPEPTPSTSKTPTPTPTPTPTTARPKPPPPKPGSLSIQGCRISSGNGSCTITLTAVGGPVTWRVTGTSAGSLHASGSGKLAKGRSATVTVTHSGNCGLFGSGAGSGSVSFSPGGSATVSWC